MFAPALWRYRSDGAFDEFQQRLLYTLTRYVTCNRGVIGLARYFVDLVDIDDAYLRAFNIVIAFLQEFLNDILDIFTDIAGFRQRGRISDGKRNVEQSRQRFRQQRFAAPGRANQ